MLNIWRRHGRLADGTKCPHKGRTWKRCACPIHYSGTLNGQFVKQATGKRVWKEALDFIHELQRTGAVKVQHNGITIQYALDSALASFEDEHLAPNTMKNWRVFFKRLKLFCDDKGIRVIAQFDQEATEMFRRSWGGMVRGQRQRLRQLRKFCGYCLDHEWLPKNYAKKIKIDIAENEELVQKLPLDLNEMRFVLDFCDEKIETSKNPKRRDEWIRLRTLSLVLRYTGLRISDVVDFAPNRIVDEDTVFLYTQKTKIPVMLPVPTYVTDALDKCPRLSVNYWFWNGRSSKETAAEKWRKMYRQIALTPTVTPHRFRDTFAVELINADRPIEDISTLLGHDNIETTQRHYLPWVMSRQLKLSENVRKVNENDPLLKELTAAPAKLRRVK